MRSPINRRMSCQVALIVIQVQGVWHKYSEEGGVRLEDYRYKGGRDETRRIATGMERDG